MLLVPAAYYASHLLAVAGPWYRYMYPPALLVQTGCLVLAVGAGVRLVRKLRAVGGLNPAGAGRVRPATTTAEPAGCHSSEATPPG